jgi:hypothetical protein
MKLHAPTTVDHILLRRLYLISLLTLGVIWQQYYAKYIYRFLQNIPSNLHSLQLFRIHCIEKKGSFAQAVFRHHTWSNIL